MIADDLSVLGPRVVAALARREAETPWIAGTTSLALARDLETDEAALIGHLRDLVASGTVAERSRYFFTPGYRPQPTAEQRAVLDAAVAVDDEHPLIPIALAHVTAALRTSRVRGIQQAFDALLVGGELVQIGRDVYRAAQIAEIRARLAAAAAGGPVTPARFRDAVGTSRKFAVPLLEWFDATGVTVRVGDARALSGDGENVT